MARHGGSIGDQLIYHYSSLLARHGGSQSAFSALHAGVGSAAGLSMPRPSVGSHSCSWLVTAALNLRSQRSTAESVPPRVLACHVVFVSSQVGTGSPRRASGSLARLVPQSRAPTSALKHVTCPRARFVNVILPICACTAVVATVLKFGVPVRQFTNVRFQY